jgi:hypothetical protein
VGASMMRSSVRGSGSTSTMLPKADPPGHVVVIVKTA